MSARSETRPESASPALIGSPRVRARLLGVGAWSWIGIPARGSVAFAQVTDSGTAHFLLRAGADPSRDGPLRPGAVLAQRPLPAGHRRAAPGDEDEEEGDGRRLRGPLEPMFLVVGMAIAFVALCVWFFFFAKNPPEIVWSVMARSVPGGRGIARRLAQVAGLGAEQVRVVAAELPEHVVEHRRRDPMSVGDLA